MPATPEQDTAAPSPRSSKPSPAASLADLPPPADDDDDERATTSVAPVRDEAAREALHRRAASAARTLSRLAVRVLLSTSKYFVCLIVFAVAGGTC